VSYTSLYGTQNNRSIYSHYLKRLYFTWKTNTQKYKDTRLARNPHAAVPVSSLNIILQFTASFSSLACNYEFGIRQYWHIQQKWYWRINNDRELRQMTNIQCITLIRVECSVIETYFNTFSVCNSNHIDLLNTMYINN